MDHLKSELERAVWHVAQATKIIVRQLTLVHAFGGMSYAAQATKSTLDAVVSALKDLENCQRLLRDEIAPREDDQSAARQARARIQRKA